MRLIMNKTLLPIFIKPTRSFTHVLSAIIASFIFLSCTCTLMGQDKHASNGNSDNTLLDQLIQSKGTTITFDSSNIKQFWTDLSVVSIDNSIKVFMKNNNNTFESIPFKIQLANVNEAMNCRIDIFSNYSSTYFNVLDNTKKTISSSQNEEKFLDYFVSTSSFQLENTLDYTFFLKFNSDSKSDLSIKKIVLSFSNNDSSVYLVSPGKIVFSEKGLNTSSEIVSTDSNIISATGKQSIIYFSKRILVSNNSLHSSLKAKNTGDVDTIVYFGYGIYTNHNIKLDAKNFPYKNINKVLTVISSSPESNKIVVDTNTEWSPGCFLALDVKEDMSDIPSTNITDGKIVKITDTNDGHAEITLDKPIKTPLKEGTLVRIHGKSGAFLYTNRKMLHPGEEVSFAATIKKDDNCLEYSSVAFPKDTHYVIPVILSFSTDQNAENTIQIIESSVSY